VLAEKTIPLFWLKQGSFVFSFSYAYGAFLLSTFAASAPASPLVELGITGLALLSLS